MRLGDTRGDPHSNDCPRPCRPKARRAGAGIHPQKRRRENNSRSGTQPDATEWGRGGNYCRKSRRKNNSDAFGDVAQVRLLHTEGILFNPQKDGHVRLTFPLCMYYTCFRTLALFLPQHVSAATIHLEKTRTGGASSIATLEPNRFFIECPSRPESVRNGGERSVSWPSRGADGPP